MTVRNLILMSKLDVRIESFNVCCNFNMGLKKKKFIDIILNRMAIIFFIVCLAIKKYGVGWGVPFIYFDWLPCSMFNIKMTFFFLMTAEKYSDSLSTSNSYFFNDFISSAHELNFRCYVLRKSKQGLQKQLEWTTM